MPHQRQKLVNILQRMKMQITFRFFNVTKVQKKVSTLAAICLVVSVKELFFLLNFLKLMFYVAQSNLNNYGLKELIVVAPGIRAVDEFL